MNEASGYSQDMLTNVVDYFDVPGNREDAIADGTFPYIQEKVRRSCEVFNIPTPSWAQN